MPWPYTVSLCLSFANDVGRSGSSVGRVGWRSGRHGFLRVFTSTDAMSRGFLGSRLGSLCLELPELFPCYLITHKPETRSKPTLVPSPTEHILRPQRKPNSQTPTPVPGAPSIACSLAPRCAATDVSNPVRWGCASTANPPLLQGLGMYSVFRMRVSTA